MALTRQMLSAMEIPSEKIDEIINAHVETVDALKGERDKYKEDAAKLTKVEAQLAEVKKELAETDKNDDWKQKYDDLKSDYDKYKSDVENKATKSAKEAAYKELLKEAGVSDKRIATVLRVTDLDSIKLDKDGKIEDAASVTESIKKEWSDFIVTKTETGAQTATPPANGASGTVKTKEEIMKIKDTGERQKAWAEYLNNKED